MRQRIVPGLLVALLALAGCGGGGGAPAEGPRAARPAALKVGLLLDDVHERWERDRQLIREVVEEIGAELLVEHQHVFGSCRGTLRVSPSGVAFVASDSRDTFTFEPGRFESALGDRTLTLKDGKRTYRFKAANGAGQGGAADLRAFAAAISDIQPR